MIARTWRGAVRRADSDAYAEYMNGTGVAGYRAGEGVQTAIFSPEDDRFLVERDLTFFHYEVVTHTGE